MSKIRFPDNIEYNKKITEFANTSVRRENTKESRALMEAIAAVASINTVTYWLLHKTQYQPNRFKTIAICSFLQLPVSLVMVYRFRKEEVEYMGKEAELKRKIVQMEDDFIKGSN